MSSELPPIASKSINVWLHSNSDGCKGCSAGILFILSFVFSCAVLTIFLMKTATIVSIWILMPLIFIIGLVAFIPMGIVWMCFNNRYDPSTKNWINLEEQRKDENAEARVALINKRRAEEKAKAKTSGFQV